MIKTKVTWKMAKIIQHDKTAVLEKLKLDPVLHNIHTWAILDSVLFHLPAT